MVRARYSFGWLAALALAACGAPAPESAVAPAAPYDFVITGAQIVDGTGAAAYAGEVAIRGDRIVEVGAAGSRADAAAGRRVDAAGLVLAPGFIDTHSHARRDIFDHPGALALVSQGVTTVVEGQDGGSAFPLAEFFTRLERQPAAVNVASYVGHGTLRRHVMGEDFRRPARPDEIDRMRALLGDELGAGALGLSSGLEYDPGIYAATGEVISLARVAAAAGGRYASHIRSEDREFWNAVEEIITIGREAKLPVQLSHTKLAMRSLWGEADRLLARLDRARAEGVEITGDIYPYTYWQSTLTVLFPRRDFESRRTAEFVLREIAAPDGLRLSRFDPNPSYVGKTVAQISALRGTSPAVTLMDLIREAQALEKATGRDAESVIGTSMAEADVERLMQWPHMNFCSDGELAGRHPRGFGSYTRVLGQYVRTRPVLTLEDAVRKMSRLAAANIGIAGRGTIEPGAYADLVLFDPATVADRATPEDPQAISAGIREVWVNGVSVFHDGQATGARPGRVIRRASAPTS